MNGWRDVDCDWYADKTDGQVLRRLSPGGPWELWLVGIPVGSERGEAEPRSIPVGWHLPKLTAELVAIDFLEDLQRLGLRYADANAMQLRVMQAMSSSYARAVRISLIPPDPERCLHAAVDLIVERFSRTLAAQSSCGRCGLDLGPIKPADVFLAERFGYPTVAHWVAAGRPEPAAAPRSPLFAYLIDSPEDGCVEEHGWLLAALADTPEQAVDVFTMELTRESGPTDDTFEVVGKELLHATIAVYSGDDSEDVDMLVGDAAEQHAIEHGLDEDVRYVKCEPGDDGCREWWKLAVVPAGRGTVRVGADWDPHNPSFWRPWLERSLTLGAAAEFPCPECSGPHASADPTAPGAGHSVGCSRRPR